MPSQTQAPRDARGRTQSRGRRQGGQANTTGNAAGAAPVLESSGNQNQKGHKSKSRQTQPPTKSQGATENKPSLITLPPELRWEIYTLLFHPPYRVSIVHQKPKQTHPPISTRSPKRLYHNLLPPRNPKTQSHPYDLKHSRQNPLPTSLIFSCKTIYRETILHLYASTQFVFHTARALARFVHTTSTPAKHALRHVELNHVMYNEPRLLGFRVFKHRADLAWYCACEDLAVACGALEVLHVRMRIWDWPIRLEVGERWSWPLLVFERFGGRIGFAGVRLEMCRFEEGRLREVAGEVERRLMGREAWEAREEERRAREVRGRVKASRVLRVVF